MDSRKALRLLSPVSDDSRENTDRLTGLPEAVLHHIFSFLDMIHVIKTASLSKSWRYIWRTLPYLNFNSRVFEYYTERERGAYIVIPPEAFYIFVNHVLQLHRSPCIHTFRFHSFQMDYCDYRILSQWISLVAHRNVEHFDLRLSVIDNPAPCLPHILFNCKSLTRLNLDLYHQIFSGYGCILPDSVDLPLLSSLRIKNMKCRDTAFLNKFFSGCRILETLEIVDMVFHDVNIVPISFPKLKDLVISMFGGFVPYSWKTAGCQLWISAPSLVSFRCKNFIPHDYFLQNLSSLEVADLHLEVCFSEDPEFAVKYLKALHNVKSLSLSNPTFVRDLSKALEVQQGTPLPFINLKHLKLVIGITLECLQTIMFILHNSRNIETLVLNIMPTQQKFITDLYASNKRHCAGEELPLQHLKYIELRDVTPDALDFLKILVKTATALEKVTIFASKTFASKEAQNIFRDELLTCFISTGGEILFH